MTASDYAKDPEAYELAERLSEKPMRVRHPDRLRPNDVNSFMYPIGDEIRLQSLRHLSVSPSDESVLRHWVGILAEE
jgi:hypothetical protein